MNSLCIIPCGAKKIWDLHPEVGATSAKNVYISAFHKACQKYAEHFFRGQWVILSAKHGFLSPDDFVSCNYDVAFNHKTRQVISPEELREQVVCRGLDTQTEVYVLGGKKYRYVVEQVFGSEIIKHYPLKDCKGIGYMLQHLNNAMKWNDLNGSRNG